MCFLTAVTLELHSTDLCLFYNIQNFFDGVQFLCWWQKRCLMSSARQQQYWKALPAALCVPSRPTGLPSTVSSSAALSALFLSKRMEKLLLLLKVRPSRCSLLAAAAGGGGYTCACLNPQPAAAEALFITMLLDLVSAGWLTERLWSGFISLALLLSVDRPFTRGLPPPSLSSSASSPPVRPGQPPEPP